MPECDRERFQRTIEEYRSKAEFQLCATGAVVDDVLRNELARAGSDARYGVNLVCYPPPEIVAQVALFQRLLSRPEPGQYYYPPGQLHLTLAEICHSQPEDQAAATARALQRVVPALLERELPPCLDSPVIVASSSAAAIAFLPRDARLQDLRAAIREHLAAHGVFPSAVCAAVGPCDIPPISGAPEDSCGSLG